MEETTASGAIGTGDALKTGDPVVEVGDRIGDAVKELQSKSASEIRRGLAVANEIEVLGNKIAFSL